MTQANQFKFITTLFLLLTLLSCSDNTANKPQQINNTQPPSAQNSIAFEDLEDDGYTLINRIDLDYLLLRNQADITKEPHGNFNFHWLRAYDCEYSSRIKNDQGLFNSVVDGLMVDVLADRMSNTNKFKNFGKISIHLSEQYENEGAIQHSFELKKYYTGSKYKGDDCVDTQVLNTRHNLSFDYINTLQAELPENLINKNKSDSKRILVDMVIKFRLYKSRFKYTNTQGTYRIYHTAKIEELALYTSQNDIWENKPFKIFYEAELYQ